MTFLIGNLRGYENTLMCHGLRTLLHPTNVESAKRHNAIRETSLAGISGLEKVASTIVRRGEVNAKHVSMKNNGRLGLWTSKI